MKNIFLLLGLSVIFSVLFLSCSSTRLRKTTSLNNFPNYYVLDSLESIQVLSQCSRWTPEAKESWKPSKEDISTLEDNLSDISVLVADSCCMGGGIKDPESYIRQYAGIIINGERYIYINAFAPEVLDGKKPESVKKPVVICDGGKGFWGALFNPKTKKFSSLAINGVG